MPNLGFPSWIFPIWTSISRLYEYQELRDERAKRKWKWGSTCQHLLNNFIVWSLFLPLDLCMGRRKITYIQVESFAQKTISNSKEGKWMQIDLSKKLNQYLLQFYSYVSFGFVGMQVVWFPQTLSVVGMQVRQFPKTLRENS